MTVVRDEPHDLVLYRAPGYPMSRRNADLLKDVPFRHPPVIRYLDGWKPDPVWGRWRVLLLTKPDAQHAVSLFWDAATGRLDFWYIDLIGAAQRRSFGFDFIEHGLDIVVEPDLSRWSWKDDAVSIGSRGPAAHRGRVERARRGEAPTPCPSDQARPRCVTLTRVSALAPIGAGAPDPGSRLTGRVPPAR